MVALEVTELSSKFQSARILEKQNCLQMGQVLSVSAYESLGDFAFQGFYSEAAPPNRRRSPTRPRDLTSRWSEARPR